MFEIKYMFFNSLSHGHVGFLKINAGQIKSVNVNPLYI